MNVVLWILAFIGVALIYGAKPIYRLFRKADPSEVTANILRAVGTLLAIGGIFALYALGKLL